MYMVENISYYRYKNLIFGSDPKQIKATTMDPIQTVHVKLMASDLLSLTVWPSNPPCFTRKGRPISRAETVGMVVSREHKDKFLRFLVDDGSGCIPCILWLNHHYLTFHDGSSNLELMAEMALKQSEIVQLGELVRVRGRITIYRGMLQITVRDVVVERDPNAEVLHWLDCIRLSKQCYDLLPAAALPGSVLNPHQDGSDQESRELGLLFQAKR
ncbi:CST complex subunit STN1-like isoform X3 [Phoenix dactylifera]|uniref:CST complex subunit STN1 n=1 Tax=Phoenix dactylifera TaxID=42345 RepID=A0A8B9AA36_PHODC|nr:CST complex subunit STN1-like isoform X3 [Phoenix dactylifera]